MAQIMLPLPAPFSNTWNIYSIFFQLLLQIYSISKISYDILRYSMIPFLWKKHLQTLVLSELFNISKHFILLWEFLLNYLYTIFKNSLGISPKDFLTEFRISKGKEQLTLTDLSVEEIAVSCGYRNSLAFGKVFKQKMGMTPTQYRNDNRKAARERLISAQNELKEYKKHKKIYVGEVEKE